MNRADYVSKVPFPELAKPLKGLRDAKGQTLVGLSAPYGDCVVLHFSECVVVLRTEGDDSDGYLNEVRRLADHDLPELQEAKVVQGNVFHGGIREAEATLEREDAD